MRGVDIGTKQEVYGMIRAEAESGRTFIWYTTEMDELAQLRPRLRLPQRPHRRRPRRATS